MRPTGVVLVALYYFVGALFLACVAAGMLLGGSFLGALFGRAAGIPSGGFGIGLIVGVFGAIFFLMFAAILAATGYGIWNLREWARILGIAFAVIGLLFSLPGLLLGHVHLHLFFGTYRLLHLVIRAAIIWYLVQPQVKAAFRGVTPAAPAS